MGLELGHGWELGGAWVFSFAGEEVEGQLQ